MGDFFKFENGDFDFPFYNDIPKLSIVDWIILLFGPLLFVAILLLPFSLNSNAFAVLSCLLCLIPVVYVSKGNLKLFFRIPERRDIKLIVLCFISYFIYAIIMATLLDYFGLSTAANPVFGMHMDVMFFVSSAIQLMGEELFKIILLIISMFVVYRFTNKRKLAVVLGVVVSLLLFALLHLPTYNYNFFQCIFVIGIGGIFNLFAYLKTKNVVASYLVHILIDFVPFIMSIIIN